MEGDGCVCDPSFEGNPALHDRRWTCVTSAVAELTDELVRDARARYERAKLETHARLVFGAAGVVAAAGIGATAFFVEGGPAPSWGRMASFAALYALVSRVEFEIGSGSAIPTQLVLVPMLFALPVAAVPVVVL